MAVPLLSDLQGAVSSYKQELYTNVRNKLAEKRLLIRSFNPENLEIRFRNIQQPLLNRFSQARDLLEKNLQEKIKDLRTRLASNVSILENASPQEIFKRGYSMVTGEDGKIIRSSDQVKIGSKICIVPAQGQIIASVEKTEQ